MIKIGMSLLKAVCMSNDLYFISRFCQVKWSKKIQ